MLLKGKTNKLIMVILFGFIFLLLPGCTKDDDTIHPINISFQTNEGSSLNSLETFDITELVLPETDRGLFDFAGWYLDSDLNIEFDVSNFNHDKTQDIILYAKWEPLVFDDFVYEQEGNDVHITRFLNSSDNIVIPEAIDGYPVTEIDIETIFFDSIINAKTVVIPSSVQKISYGAFSNFPNLEEITLPFIGSSMDSSEYFDHFGYIFQTISYLQDNTYIVFPSSLTDVYIMGTENVPSYSFYGGTYALPLNVTFNSTVTEIGEYAFWDVILTSVTISDSVLTIGDNAFLGTQLTSITILGDDSRFDGSNWTRIGFPEELE